MAIQNNPYLYTGGDVLLNPDKYLAISQRLQAKKEAQKDALGNYFTKMQYSLDPNGVRPQDMEGFNDRISKIQNYWVGNADKLKKGDVISQRDYLALINEAKGYINKSKDATQGLKEAVELEAKLRKENDAAALGKLIDDVAANDAPINDDKNFKRINPTEYFSRMLPFDEEKFLSPLRKLKRVELKPEYSSTDPITHKRTKIQKSVFGDLEKATILEEAGDAFQHNPRFASKITEAIKDPSKKSAFDWVLKTHYGLQPNENGNYSGEQYATAYTLSKLQPEIITRRDEIDILSRKSATSKRRSGRSVGGTTASGFDGYIKNRTDESIKVGSNTLAFDPKIYGSLKLDGVGLPTEIRISDDGKFYTPIYKDKQGEVLASYSKPISREQIELSFKRHVLGAKGASSVLSKSKEQEISEPQHEVPEAERPKGIFSTMISSVTKAVKNIKVADQMRLSFKKRK